jgi:hypothetical protein
MPGGDAMPLRILALVLLVVGCTATQLDSWNPPKQELKCTVTNPYLCGDGHSCCSSTRPVCMGPDSEGFYCQPSSEDAESQVLFGKGKRIRATKRVDE